MRRIGLLAALALLLSGCSTSQKVKTQPNPTTTTNTPNTGSTETIGQSPATQEAGIGDSITLHGNDDGLVIEVKLVKVVDPGIPANEFFTPDKGNRFVAVQVKMTNEGTVTYDDSPGNGAVLLDTEDQSYSWDLNDVKNCASFANASAKIAPGSSRAGCIVYQVPKATKLAGFQFTLDSGFGPETGEWTL